MNPKDQNISQLCECSIGNTQPCCFCILAYESSISIRFISNDEYHLFPFNDTYQQITDPNTNFFADNIEPIPTDLMIQEDKLKENQQRIQQPIQNISKKTRKITKTKDRKSIKDNVSHKRITKHLQDVYRQATKEKIPASIKKFNYRQDYGLMILNHLQRRGKLLQGAPCFQDAMLRFRNQISKTMKNEADRLEHFNELIQRYLKAYNMFANGKIVESIEVVYDYENMRQKENFYKAKYCINEMRRDLGLSHNE